MDKELINDIKWLKRNISVIREMLSEKAPVKETWVKAKEIMDLTGWDAEGMRKARELEYLKFREPKSRVFEYLLESLSDDFKKRKTA